MNNITICRTEKKYLDGIHRLYSGKKSYSELDWVLKEYNGIGYRSFVALENENRVVGHIGYFLADYCYNGNIYKGLHNMMWIVDPEIKGGVGLKLIAENIKHSDFSFAIGASAFTKKLFPLIKYNYQFSIPQYYKLLIPSMLSNWRYAEDSVELEEINMDSQLEYGAKNFKDVFCNTENTLHLKWLLQCPLLETYAFKIKYNGENLGISVCYINKRMNFLRTGRIVHLSYLGQDSYVWMNVIKNLSDFFVKKKTLILFVPASHHMYQRVLEKLKFKKHSYLYKPYYLYNPKGVLPDIKEKNYHFTFWEADLGYRSI